MVLLSVASSLAAKVRLDIALPRGPSSPDWLPQKGERFTTHRRCLTMVCMLWSRGRLFQIQIWLGTLDECLSQNVVFMTSMACVIVITVSADAVPQQATE